MHGGEENLDPPIKEDQWIDLPTQQQTDNNKPITYIQTSIQKSTMFQKIQWLLS